MAGAGGVNMAQFEEYFQRADSDRDGRISGHEAVAFFQGSNLSKQVLAQIWMHADQNHTGYLSRPEFYNALKLVTVAQSKRDLTPDMVKAALYGPASAKIPAPQINLAAIPVPQPNSKVAAPSLQTGASALPSSQNFGIGGQAPSTTTINQQFGRSPSATTTNQFGLAPSTAGTNQFGLAPSTTGTNQFGLAPSTTGTNHLRAPSTTGTNQFALAPSTTGTNQFGLAPSTSGMNQQFRPVQPSSTGMNQQFWQVQPSSTSTNQQLGQSQLSSTGMNQQFGQAPLSANTNKQFFPSQGNQSIGSHLSMPSGSVSHPSHGAVRPNIPSAASMVGPGLSNSNTDWFVGKTSAASAGPTTQVLKGVSSSNGPSPQELIPTFLSTAEKDPRGLVGSGNGSTLNLMGGGDVLSANQSSSQQLSSGLQQPMTSLPISSAIVPVTSGPQPSAQVDPFEALQSTLIKPTTGGQAMPKPSLPKPNQPVLTQVTSSGSLSGISPGVGNSVSEQSQISWPKMTRPSIQKYAKVFMEVDTDRDGKITGVQARNLFLSWRLPREVLKQVWDLSDQDSDSMLSLREFCIALYLMERYREGQPLPSILPNNVILDETLLSLAGPPPAYGSMGWVPSTGLTPQQGLPGAQPSVPSNMRTPMQPIVSQADSSMQFNQQNGRGAMIDTSHANQHSNGEENSHSTKGPEATETNEKVDNKENVLLDSREKLEFYRANMQDLVLYKSRCDNQLNEITERARSDKGEAELLERKYQEKYKQVAEIHSKLTIEEASFREIQARKMELHQAIIKMEQGGSVDGILQVRADRLQSDLEELLKHLTDRCKKHAVQVKSSVLIELPPGWQPGIPETATLWDEEWDKFEDEGFLFDVPVAANAKSASVEREDSSPTRSFSPNSVSNADVMSEGPFTVVTNAFETESVYSADESKSPQGTPGSQIAYESPSQEYSANHFRENSDGDAETHRSFDEPTWGNFDNNDDVDSVWGFSTKDSDHGKHEEKYFFGSKDFGASPEGTDSPQAESAFNKNSQFNFEDSVPGTPLSRAGNSPPRYSIESRDPFFDNLSRYDSFNVQDHGSSPRQENLSRFDSINSTMGFNHSSNYSFDESDPFGSSGPFKVSSETPKKDYDSQSTF